MEREKVLLAGGIIIAILLFFYSLISIFYPEKIKEKHEKYIQNSNFILSKYRLKYSQKWSNIFQRLTGIVGLLMSILMLYLFVNQLFSK